MNEIVWMPISRADKTIVDAIELPSVGDQSELCADARARRARPLNQALWTDHRRGDWWDFEAESPVDPVAFFPLLK